MSEFVQIGTAAMRDPVTGDFLPSVPLYIREEDRSAAAEPLEYDLKKLFAGKMEEYLRAERGERKKKKSR